jgi:hypothetical protein
VTIPIWRWVVALLILLAFLAFCGVLVLGLGEDICFDRSPWWGPPEDPTSTCAGHWYESRHGVPFPNR